MKKIIIILQGGLVQEVLTLTGETVEVNTIDYDIDGSSLEETTEIPQIVEGTYFPPVRAFTARYDSTSLPWGRFTELLDAIKKGEKPV